MRELLALLHTEGRLGLDASAARSASVPIAVQDVIRRRTSRQPPETQALMASAAVIGRRFDLDVLAAVVDLDAARVLELLGPALDAGLVEVDDAVAGRYGFSHALVAETLVAEQNPSRLAQLHAQITIALERLRAGRLDGSLEELAHHACEGAPAGTARQAFRYSLAAADASHEARASGDEAEHLRRALAVQPTAEPGAAAQRVELLIRMGAGAARHRRCARRAQRPGRCRARCRGAAATTTPSPPRSPGSARRTCGQRSTGPCRTRAPSP